MLDVLSKGGTAAVYATDAGSWLTTVAWPMAVGQPGGPPPPKLWLVGAGWGVFIRGRGGPNRLWLAVGAGKRYRGRRPRCVAAPLPVRTTKGAAVAQGGGPRAALL